MQYGILTFDDPKPNTNRKILHVDMDAFYASVEMRDNPDLKDKPVVIAHHPRKTGGKGIVSTCNYIARSYGIRSAMPAMEAYRLCPHAVFIEGDMGHYAEVSSQIREIFQRYTDLIEPMSLDEAYLDVTHNKKEETSALKIALDIQKTLYKEVGLTCSIGVSYNKFIAKIASDFKKPSGITLVLPEEAELFLSHLPIEKFYGIGKKSLPSFQKLGIERGQDLRQYDLEFLVNHFGKNGHYLYFRVRGIDDSPVQPTRERKSIGRERTFNPLIIDDPNKIMIILGKLTESVVKKIRHKGLLASQVSIKIRYQEFETLTRQITLGEPTDDEEMIFQKVSFLWNEHGDDQRAVRLLGVTLGHIIDPEKDAIQLKLEERNELI